MITAEEARALMPTPSNDHWAKETCIDIKALASVGLTELTKKYPTAEIARRVRLNLRQLGFKIEDELSCTANCLFISW